MNYHNETKSARLQLWLYRAALIACLLVPVAFGLMQTTAHFDDAYITYRYARNLAAGQGFVYNPGEAVLGTTAALYGLLLGLLHLLGLDIPQTSHVLSVVGWAACVILVERIGQATHERGIGLLAAALVATSPLFLQVIGMETNLTLALALGAMYLYLIGHTRAAFVVAALATWMRPDCTLAALVLGLAYVWERRALPWREGLLFVATLLPWLVFAWLTYGSFLPNSFFAKFGQGHGSYSFGPGLIQVASDLSSANHLYWLIGLLGLIGLVEIARRRPQWLIVIAWAGVYTASYLLMAVPYFYWYYLPLWPAVALLTAAGIVATARWLNRLGSLARFNRAWPAILLGLTLIPQFQVLRTSLTLDPPPYNQGYTAIADWLKANTAPDASVAMIEIGIIGYYSDRRVVDVMGLVTPEVTRHLDSGYQMLVYAMQRYWPDYTISLQGTAWDYIKRDLWFTEAYTPAIKIPSAGPGSRTATIYRRVAGFPVRTFDLTHSYDLAAGEAINLSAIRVQSTQMESGDVLHAQIKWRARQRTRYDVKVLIDLVNAQSGQRWPLAIEQPMRGGAPTFVWRPDDVILDDYALPLPSDLNPGAYLLDVRLLNVTTDEPLTFTHANVRNIPRVAVGPVWVGPATLSTYRITTPMQATFGDAIELLGYDPPNASFAKGEPVPLTLYWRAREPVEADYTVFVHIVDSAGHLVAQQDNPPVQGNLPTSLWLPGIVVRDYYQIKLPADQAAGEYTIKIGMYTGGTGERLAIHSPSDEAQDRVLDLSRIALR